MSLSEGQWDVPAVAPGLERGEEGQLQLLTGLGSALVYGIAGDHL